MQVWMNGSQRELAAGSRVRDALDQWGVPQSGVAVAVDGQVVPRAAWAETELVEGARVEVLTAVQGG